MLQLIYQQIICIETEKEMKTITMRHILGNKVLQYDVDDRGVIVDEREYDTATYKKDTLVNETSSIIVETSI